MAAPRSAAARMALRHRDPTFEKLMSRLLLLLRATSVVDLVLASPGRALPLPLLLHPSSSRRLRLPRGAPHFLRSHPHLFSLRPDPKPPSLLLTPAAASAAAAADSSSSAAGSSAGAGDLLRRLLSMSPSRALPLRALFRAWRPLGLPDDFEDSVLAAHPSLFSLLPHPREPSSHLLSLLHPNPNPNPNPNPPFLPAVERWRNQQDDPDLKFSFKLGFPPGMRLSKDYRAKLRSWQRLPYPGPYDPIDECGATRRRRRSRDEARRMEKRAVGIAHEFLSLTVEKMVEVETFSQFRNWFRIELNVRDLFLDHPGIFYLSAKGGRHTVFLREAYDRGRLIEPNPIYDARMKLLDLALLKRRGIDSSDAAQRNDDDDNNDDDDDDELVQ